MSIYIVLKGHEGFNDAQIMTQVFYPNEKYTETDEISQTGITVVSEPCSASLYEGGLLICRKEAVPSKNSVKTAIYSALSQYTGLRPKWGILTGIRPAKLVREWLLEGLNEEEICEKLEKEYLTVRPKAELALTVAKKEISIIAEYPRDKKTCALYIGIPFCPTRCLYCSFTSYPVKKHESQIEAYLDCLILELNSLPDAEIDCIYIGGGTPTSLSNMQLARLLQAVSHRYNPSGIEYTLEAGRPDTITDEKLKTIKSFGITRLSINPQSMNDETLALVGRSHSTDEIYAAYKMAENAGFDNINMDIILGLPKEDHKMVEYSLKKIYELNPAALTVHTLAIKRASRLNENLGNYELTSSEAIEEMMALAKEYSSKMNMQPYYMYRQKNMLGNFENVGYAKEGFHCGYNIKIMEETQTILAVGAGAITKLVKGRNISRIINVKSLEDYLKKIDKITEIKNNLKLD